MYPRAVGILGSDGYVHASAVRVLVVCLALDKPVTIVTRARGSSVDRVVRLEAKRCGLPLDLAPTGRRTRHDTPEHYVVARSDQLHAFWDGRSPGTRHAIALARAHGVPVHVHRLVE